MLDVGTRTKVRWRSDGRHEKIRINTFLVIRYIRVNLKKSKSGVRDTNRRRNLRRFKRTIPK
jgi:hypothetical protein